MVLLLILLITCFSKINSNERIVAIGDLHGDLKQTRLTFRMAGLIDAKDNWIGGKTILVQTGDVVDRGLDTIKVFELLKKLIGQAKEAGGQVINLLGNHEFMNIIGDWGYVENREISSFGSKKRRIEEWSDKGKIGMYVRDLKIMAKLDGNVFVHGGITPEFAKKEDRLNAVGELGMKNSNLYRGKDIKNGIFGDNGPLWYRGYADKSEEEICPLLEQALQIMKAKRMVVGHTVQSDGKIHTRCNHQLYLIDVGICSFYGSKSAALEIIGDDIKALYPRWVNGKLITVRESVTTVNNLSPGQANSNFLKV